MTITGSCLVLGLKNCDGKAAEPIWLRTTCIRDHTPGLELHLTWFDIGLVLVQFWSLFGPGYNHFNWFSPRMNWFDPFLFLVLTISNALVLV